MEWKRAKGGVAVQQCHDDLTDRLTIAGDYNKHECGLTVTNTTEEDGGSWECQMEEYKWGDWVSGRKHQHSFDVSIRLRTTTTTTTTTTITTVTTTRAPTQTNIEEFETTTDVNFEDLAETTSEYKETIEDDFESFTGRSNIPRYDEIKKEAVVKEEHTAEELIEPIAEKVHLKPWVLIVGLVVLFLVLAAGAGVGVMIYKRKRKSVGMVALHKIKDKTGASHSFLEDSEYNVSIMGEPED